MISLAVAWVYVTAIKKAGCDIEISPGIFVVTGFFDFLIVGLLSG